MVNYIKHLTEAMNRLAEDERCAASHVGLYYALFYYWNKNRFRNPTSIGRDDLRKMSHVGSIKIYYQCMKDLDAWGYIRYMPSSNLRLASKVTMIRFDLSKKSIEKPPEDSQTASANDAPMASPADPCMTSSDDLSTGSSATHDGVPSINSINISNNLNLTNHDDHTQKISDLCIDRTDRPPHGEDPVTGDLDGRRRPEPIPHSIGQVADYFQEKEAPREEAEKFYHYFNANGWRVGGRTAMKDWRAAARYWILNINKFSGNQHAKSQPFKPQITGPKNYAEPF